MCMCPDTQAYLQESLLDMVVATRIYWDWKSSVVAVQ